MKKVLAIILVLVTVLGLCACGGGGKKEKTVQTTPDGRIKLTIGLPASATTLDHKDNALTKWLEKECGVDLTFIEYSGGTDISTQITSTIAARQELPDILMGMDMTAETIYTYGHDGYFLNLKDYLADKEGVAKTFWDRVNNELTEDQRNYLIHKITEPGTDNVYAMPVLEISNFDTQHFQAYINRQWLDKLQLETPKDTESLYNVLKAFRDNDCNGNGDPTDEIPLFGSQVGGMCSKPVDWLLEMFMYYNRYSPYTVGADGKLSTMYTSNEYREGLKFINKLYAEGLLTTMAWTASKPEVGSIATPIDKVAKCGIILVHPSSQPLKNNEVLYEYEPIEYWHPVYWDDPGCTTGTFITEDCAAPEKAFELLMKMFSWDGSMRQRYGEYGTNWTDPTPGAISVVGLPCKYKLINDPLRTQNTVVWTCMASTINMNAECEDAELASEMTEWNRKKYELMAAHLENFREAEEKYNPEKICPTLFYTKEEQDKILTTQTNVDDYWHESQVDFCSGLKDPNSDTQWNEYLAKLKELGVDAVLAAAQVAYDRS